MRAKLVGYIKTISGWSLKKKGATHFNPLASVGGDRDANQQTTNLAARSPEY